jgi:hypothetical protein
LKKIAVLYEDHEDEIVSVQKIEFPTGTTNTKTGLVCDRVHSTCNAWPPLKMSLKIQ